MNKQPQKEVFGIRTLKAGVYSVAVAITFLGMNQVLANEVTASISSITDEATAPQTALTSSASTAATTVSTNDSSVTTDQPVESVSTVSTQSEASTSTSTVSALSVASSGSSETEKIPTEISVRNVAETSNTPVSTEPLNVKSFGAVGDGVTDDRQAIQDAIDAAAEGLGSGKVYFPEGTYFVEEIVVLKSNTHLELHDNATILNGINQKNHPSIVFMTGVFTDDGAQVEWGPTENISVTGGTIDMNGALNEEGTKPKNLPLINSAGAFAIANTTNFTIRNVTFRDSYKGHAIQIAGSKDVLIDHSRFLGQALTRDMKDSQIISKESIQIEPLTRKGFPYALNDTGAKSENITIQNSYFGKSDKTGELVIAVGTHYQDSRTENPSNIKIVNNHFDNMLYAGVRFTGFTDVVIQGNIFDKKSKEESVYYREGGAALINAYSYNNVKDVLDLNKKVVIDNNVFNISDAKTKAIRAARDKAEYLGRVTDITVTNNTIDNLSVDSQVPNIQMLRISHHLNISNNTITGGLKGISIENSTGAIDVSQNAIIGSSSHAVSVTDSGNMGTITVQTHNGGNLEMATVDGSYQFRAKDTDSDSFVASYSDAALTSIIDNVANFSFPVDQADRIAKHLLFKPSSKITVIGDLTKLYDGQAVNESRLKIDITGSTGKVRYAYFADERLTKEMSAPAELGKYWLKISVEGDHEFAAASTVMPFEILGKQVPDTAPIAEKLPEIDISKVKAELEAGQKEHNQAEKVTNEVSKPANSSKQYVSSTTVNKTLPKTGESMISVIGLQMFGSALLVCSIAKRRKYDDK